MYHPRLQSKFLFSQNFINFFLLENKINQHLGAHSPLSPILPMESAAAHPTFNFSPSIVNRRSAAANSLTPLVLTKQNHRRTFSPYHLAANNSSPGISPIEFSSFTTTSPALFHSYCEKGNSTTDRSPRTPNMGSVSVHKT